MASRELEQCLKESGLVRAPRMNKPLSDAAIALLRDRQVQSDRALERQRKAGFLARAINAAFTCTRHRALSAFAETSKQRTPVRSPRDVDWDAYITFWVRKCMLPLVQALLALEENGGESVLPLLMSRLTVSSEQIKKKSGFVQDLFINLFNARGSATSAKLAIADLRAVLDGDWDSWVQYHMWFELLERDLRTSWKSWQQGESNLIHVAAAPNPPVPQKKRGPKPRYDADGDHRIAAQWNTKKYPTYAALERELGLAKGGVKSALDRDRKRRAKLSTKRSATE